MTLPEGMLWQVLRERPRAQVPPQHPIGRFVVDFYCPAARLVIEVDGVSHSMGDNPERDCGPRSAAQRARTFALLRFAGDRNHAAMLRSVADRDPARLSR